MTIRDLANWALDQSAWWLLVYASLWVVAVIIAALGKQ